MRVVIFGVTGMVGRGVLKECLDDDGVEDVLVVGRRECGERHKKLREVLHDDFFDSVRFGPSLQTATPASSVWG